MVKVAEMTLPFRSRLGWAARISAMDCGAFMAAAIRFLRRILVRPGSSVDENWAGVRGGWTGRVGVGTIPGCCDEVEVEEADEAGVRGGPKLGARKK